MVQLHESQAEDMSTEKHDDSASNPLLLDSRQWSYVQRLYDLTPREIEIAEQVCKGFRSCNIAKNLRIKPGTVKTHTRNIYRKVRVKSKIAMLLRFVGDTKDI